MMNSIGGNLTPGTLQLIDPSNADPDLIREAHVWTQEGAQIYGRILPMIAAFPNPQPGGYLFSGDRGTGKTHLLRHLGNLLANPSDPKWSLLCGTSAVGKPLVRPLKSLYFSLPSDPAVSLAGFLAKSLRESFSASETEHTGIWEISDEELSAQLLVAASDFCANSVAMIVIDDVSRRLDRLHETDAVEREVAIFKILTEVFSGSGILVFLILENRHVEAKQGMHKHARPLEDLSKSFERISFSRKYLSEVITNSLTAKSEAQKAAVRDIVHFWREKLPWLSIRTSTVVDLYPLHPLVLAATFSVSRVLEEFSPLRFVHDAIENVRTRPAEGLVTLDMLFDFVLRDLRNCPAFAIMADAFEKAFSAGIPRMKPAVQPRVAKLLKAITLWTLCESQPASVRFLANSLLLYEQSEFLPSYNLVAALLQEMEQISEFNLLAEGEKLDRGYRILAGDIRPASPVTRNPWEKQEFRLKFPLVLGDWLQKEVPNWKLNLGPRYQRSSQAMTGTLAGGESHLNGLVFLKSPFDPHWSDQDLAALDASGHHWILLVLSPFERFFEYESTLRKIAASSTRMLIWRPDAPQATENESLYDAVMSYPLPWEPAPQGGMDPNERKRDAWEIMGSLYIRRGQFFTASEQWTIDNEIEGVSPGEYLSASLASLALTSAELKGLDQTASLDRIQTDQKTLHWAALLSGLEEIKTMDGDSAEICLATWWKSSFQMDSAALLVKLHALPDPLITTRCRSEIKTFESSLELLKPIMERLLQKEITFVDAMAMVANHFKRDVKRLIRWRRLLEDLAGFLRWSISYNHARDYICGAFPTGQENLDQLRAGLMHSMDQPHKFLESEERDKFDRIFLEFKRSYSDYYNAVHEDTLQILGNLDRIQAKLDSVSLRNLELFSRLHYVDKYYLNRVRIIGKWIHRNQCDLPVRKILDRYPRCYCNFNPSSGPHQIRSIDRINTAITEGNEYFRLLLRRGKKILFKEIAAQRLDRRASKQLLAFISGAPAIPLSPSTVEALNMIFQEHSAEFLALIRSQPQRPRERHPDR